jgi:hypothetical protein
MIDASEYQGDVESVDLFDLNPEIDSDSGSALLATAIFRRTNNDAGVGWEVCWTVLDAQ